MKKLFLTTCLILIASLSFSQGYFSKEEIKKYGLEVEYDKFSDTYFYEFPKFKKKGKWEYNGGQSPNMYFYISYSVKDKKADLTVTFTYDLSRYIDLKEVQLYIDGEKMTFREDVPYRNKVEYSDKWVYHESMFLELTTDNKKDLDTLIFLSNLEDAQDVSVRLIGKSGYEQANLTKKQIEASDKMLTIFADKEFPED